MRRTDEPLDPEVMAELEAIDAVLAGEPVDPEYAELAELALLVAAERPAVEVGFAVRLDERVERRFAAPPVPVAPPSTRFRRRVWGWSLGLAGSVAAAVAVVVVLLGSGGGSRTLPERTSSTAAAAASSSSSGSAAQ